MTDPLASLPDREPDVLAWTQQLLTVLDEGKRSATYKLAVLLALIDCCVLGTDSAGRAPERVPTRDLASRVLELYWRQVRDYPCLDDGPLLRQSSQPRAVTVDAVRGLRLVAELFGARTPADAQRLVPQDYQRALDVIELNLVRMPLGKLQRPAGYRESTAAPYPRFLYEDDQFDEHVTARQLRTVPMVVNLLPGVPDRLVSMAGLVRPLVELHWTRAVARLNGHQLTEDRLSAFLFGAERESLTNLRAGLHEAQEGRCFYCRGALVAGRTQVDHFVPWSRVPNDALGNLVLADSGCNSSKSDRFADLDLLHCWALRPEALLKDLATQKGWPLQMTRSRRLARGLYSHLPGGTLLWSRPGHFEPLDAARLRDVLPLLDTT